MLVGASKVEGRALLGAAQIPQLSFYLYMLCKQTIFSSDPIFSHAKVEQSTAAAVSSQPSSVYKRMK